MAILTLYLIRHGLAGERGSDDADAERPLTDEGKKKTRQVAKRLDALNLKFDLILTSPLIRAQQTAEILVSVGLSHQLQQSEHLAPGGYMDAWLAWLQTWRQTRSAEVDSNLALVGHEPDLTTWAEMLLWGAAKGAISLKKAGVIGLTLPENEFPIGRSCLFWLTPPRFLLN
jgi:phosphohistidine phosphatase